MSFGFSFDKPCPRMPPDYTALWFMRLRMILILEREFFISREPTLLDEMEDLRRRNHRYEGMIGLQPEQTTALLN